MSERHFEKCFVCNEYHWSDEECAPLFLVEHVDKGYVGEDKCEVRAHSMQEAAEKYAEEYDSDDHSLLASDETERIRVFDDHGNSRQFDISAEAAINYYADEMPDESDE